jgi:hypothetical protein
MVIVKFQTDGSLIWSVRVGADGNDLANELQYYGGFVFVVGSSDSTGWSVAKTDLVIMQMNIATGSLNYI